MDASLALPVIVWAALGVGLASILYCVFSGAPLTSEEDPEGSGLPSTPEAEAEAGADTSG